MNTTKGIKCTCRGEKDSLRHVPPLEQNGFVTFPIANIWLFRFFSFFFYKKNYFFFLIQIFFLSDWFFIGIMIKMEYWFCSDLEIEFGEESNSENRSRDPNEMRNCLQIGKSRVYNILVEYWVGSIQYVSEITTHYLSYQLYLYTRNA